MGAGSGKIGGGKNLKEDDEEFPFFYIVKIFMAECCFVLFHGVIRNKLTIKYFLCIIAVIYWAYSSRIEQCPVSRIWTIRSHACPSP